MSPLSTREVAGLVGVHPITLERWLASGKIPAPGPLRIGGRIFRRWTERDIERVKQYKAKFYRKGRGPKKGK